MTKDMTGTAKNKHLSRRDKLADVRVHVPHVVFNNATSASSHTLIKVSVYRRNRVTLNNHEGP